MCVNTVISEFYLTKAKEWSVDNHKEVLKCEICGVLFSSDVTLLRSDNKSYLQQVFSGCDAFILINAKLGFLLVTVLLDFIVLVFSTEKLFFSVFI